MTGNGNTDRLLGELGEGVRGLREDFKDFKREVENDFRDLKDAHHLRLNNHGDRIAMLERDRDVRQGGAKMLTALLAGAVVIGGLIAQLLNLVIGKFWSG